MERQKENDRTMKAVRIHEFGDPDVLVYEDAPRPKPKAGQVLVRVHAAGVGAWDPDIRRGEWQEMIEYPLPLILGTDVSGVVEAVGSRVTNLQKGQEVYGVADMTLSGSNAEYALGKAGYFAAKPKSIDHVQAASVPVVAATAWQMLFDLAHLTEGQTVLIHGAAGSVGQFAVQFAKRKGARVIGNASGQGPGICPEFGSR